MTQPLFSKASSSIEHWMNPHPGLPRIIYLDVFPLLDELNEFLKQEMPDLLDNKDLIISDLIQCLQYEEQALFEVQSSSLELMDGLDSVSEFDDRYIRLRNTIGAKLYHLFVQLGLYVSNYLFYGVKAFEDDHTLILEKIQIPKLDTDRR